MAKRPDELDVIAQIKAIARPSAQVIAGIGDDCAVLRPPRGHDVLVTTDFCLEGRHFRRDTHSPESAGHRTLARGLSDLAAMGARPLAAFLSLALPKGLLQTAAGRRWFAGYLQGIESLAREHRVPLAGGDTAQSPSEHVLADIVLTGTVPRGRALRRTGAKVGDSVYVTGSLGGSAAELAVLFARPGRWRGFVDHPQLFPNPRLRVGQALLRRTLATACMDLSDGLSTDLRHLVEASGVSAQIEEAALPVHARATLEQALHGGEDYELLFTAKGKIPKKIAGVAVTRIGRIVAAKSGEAMVALVGRDGVVSELHAGGWKHLG